MINEIRNKSLIPIPGEMIMNPSVPLIYVKGEYNEKFWKSYNVLELTPLDRKIVEDLEKKMPLE